MRRFGTLTMGMIASVGFCLVATGCAADRNKDIPAQAKLVAQGEKDLAYRAPQDGTVFVFDKSGQNVLYSGKVDRDDLVKIDAMKDRITINDRVVMDKQIRDHDALNIFFDPQPRRDAVIDAREAGGRTVIREREVRTEPRTDGSRSDSTITVHPDRDRVTVEGNTDSKVTIEQPNTDSKVTIERGAGQPR
jgi:hypothetical protein